MSPLEAVREFFALPGEQIGRLSEGGESAPYVCRGCVPREVPVEYARHLDSLGDERTGLTVYRTERQRAARGWRVER